MKTDWARRGTWAKTDWVAQRKIEIVFAILFNISELEFKVKIQIKYNFKFN
jgi:hypothetical protein